MNKKIVTVGIVACAVIGGAGWYWGYYTKTPAYSLGIIKTSIQKHDVSQFKKHVDLDSFLSRGYDDLIEAGIEDNKNSADSYESLGANFAKGLFVALKPTITGAIKDKILRAVEDGAWENKKDDTSKKDNGQTIDTDNIVEETGIKSAEYKGIVSTKKDGKIAVVGLEIYEPTINENYVLDLKMRELEDGTWQLVEASNLKEYLSKIKLANQKSLKKYIDDRAAAIKPYNDEIETKFPEGKQMTVELYDDLLAIHEKIEEEAQKIPVPKAAEKYVSVVNEANKIRTDEMRMARDYLAGNRDSQMRWKLQQSETRLGNLIKEINGIKESVKNVDTGE